MTPTAASRAGGWWVWPAVAALLFAAAFGTNVPTPLLLIYRVRLGIAPSGLAAIFGVYALGLAPSLLFGGPASDRYGRARVLVPAVVLTGVASLIFLPGAGSGAGSVAVLFVARFVQGLASGAAFSVGSAWLQELVGPVLAARRASVALNLGFCAGPLTSGLLAETTAAPLTVPYLVHVTLVVVVSAGAMTLIRRSRPARVGLKPAGPAHSLLPRAGLTTPARRIFRRTVIPTAVCVYAFPSVAVTVLPLELPHRAHLVAFTGVLAAAALGAGTLVQPVAHRLGPWCGVAGVALGALGYGAGALAAAPQSTGLVLVGGVLLGAGGGLCLNDGLRLVGELAPPQSRGACNGLFYTWAYAGFAMPLLATSFVPVTRIVVPLLVLAAGAATVAARLALVRH